ncbi:MAG: dihydrofolate reductase [Pseudomonadota bacterium]
MKISMIVAMSANRVIGINNQLPWRLSADMAWFKKQTMGKTLLLGRKTWESLPLRPLPGRRHIILSSNNNYQPLSIGGEKLEGINIATSVEQAMGFAEENLQQSNEELMVIGGATIYQLLLPFCDKLYITQLKGNFNGDAWFPEFDPQQWQNTFLESHQADEKNQYDFDFIIKKKLK